MKRNSQKVSHGLAHTTNFMSERPTCGVSMLAGPHKRPASTCWRQVSAIWEVSEYTNWGKRVWPQYVNPLGAIDSISLLANWLPLFPLGRIEAATPVRNNKDNFVCNV